MLVVEEQGEAGIDRREQAALPACVAGRRIKIGGAVPGDPIERVGADLGAGQGLKRGKGRFRFRPGVKNPPATRPQHVDQRLREALIARSDDPIQRGLRLTRWRDKRVEELARLRVIDRLRCSACRGAVLAARRGDHQYGRYRKHGQTPHQHHQPQQGFTSVLPAPATMTSNRGAEVTRRNPGQAQQLSPRPCDRDRVPTRPSSAGGSAAGRGSPERWTAASTRARTGTLPARPVRRSPTIPPRESGLSGSASRAHTRARTAAQRVLGRPWPRE